MLISLKPFDLQSAADMVEQFSTDEILRKELGLDKTEFSAEEEYRFVSDWCEKTNSMQFAIRYENEFAGMISLSHIDEKLRTARIGYWVGSGFRNKGICSEAFRMILNIARDKGIVEVRSDIDKDNEYSMRIWEKYSPVITERNEKQAALIINIL
ncbi:MAG TPA: GNAT family N-acetyltransferase [Clostridiales bacterium]|nr:GNAT family N-acetyltransferase [Clostridiales bacterium]